MQLHLISVGTRMPKWAADAYEEFAKRLPHECRIRLHEIAAVKRTKNSDPNKCMVEEGERMLATIPKGALIVTLDVKGKQYSSEELSSLLQKWMADGPDVALLIGGADGLSKDCLQKANSSLSLSKLTMPHMLVRVVLAEQIYRAWSISRSLPYHRA